MSEHIDDDGGYTPPAGRYGTTDAEHSAYLAGHSAGWSHANFAAAYRPDDGTTEQAAQRFADGGRYPDGAARSRAVEGFVDGAEAFDEGDDDN